MSQTPLQQRMHRVAEFAERSFCHPGGVYLHRGSGTKYLPIHPFSDEPEVLTQLAIKPENCIAVDAYWEAGADVIFLQVWRGCDDMVEQPGLFARWSTGPLPMLNLVAVVEAATISRDLFESVMSHFLELGVPDAKAFEPTIGDKLMKLWDAG